MARRHDTPGQPLAGVVAADDQTGGHLAERNACLLKRAGLGLAPGALGQVAEFFGGQELVHRCPNVRGI